MTYISLKAAPVKATQKIECRDAFANNLYVASLGNNKLLVVDRK